MNRVYCLYRVTTVQQLHEDDIPMQRQACQEFAAARGWKIVKELYEKGVSGFKTPIADRRVLQQIKKDAELKKFDILLVFMFDRLGRRDSETPFFVEDLAMCGIHEPCVVRFFSVEEAKNGIRKQALFSTLWGCEPSGGYFCKIAGNGWFAGPALSSKSCKKAVKSSISRPFLVETKRIELSTLRMRTVRSPS